METAKVNGVELEYEDQGDGEPVMLITCGPIADGCRPFMTETVLAERHRLIRYHRRGMVRSTHTQPPVSFAEHAADAAALLTALGVYRAHVVGHSTGAAIGMQLALEHRALVQSLALLEPPLLEVPSAGAFLDQVGPSLAAYAAGDREAAMAEFLSVVCSLEWEPCRAAIEAHVAGGVAQAIEDADNFFDSELHALTTWSFGPEQAAAISQPVLSVLGLETHQLFAESHALLHAWFPQVEDCRVQGVAHLLHMQAPRPVAQGLAAFFGRHPIGKEWAGPPVAGGARSGT